MEKFHVVFTLPEEIAAIAYQNKAVVHDILFQATAETLQTIAADPKHLGAECFIALLHTWGQNLMHHPHLHCVALRSSRRRPGFGRLALDFLSPRFLPAGTGALAALTSSVSGAVAACV